MGLRIGIDVGGTFTDAVVVQDNKVTHQAKVPTTDSLLNALLHAIDELKVTVPERIEQITVSTTLVTNAVVQNRLPRVEVLLFPGHGMKLDALPWPVPYEVLAGEIDYRGREIQPPDELEWKRLVRYYQKNDITHLAIIGKFSHRNNRHEVQLADYVKKALPGIKIGLGHEWGQANFYRRSMTAYLNLGSRDLFTRFAQDLETAVRARGFVAPIFVLKADGGVIPLEKLRPIESIYSGPAASVLGALAQSEPSSSCVVIDIGGTTTDMGVILSGAPLLSSKGATIGKFSTLVRSLAVRSIAVGADSSISAKGNSFTIHEYRMGPAACLGGSIPTPTDAMCYLGLTEYGDRRLARQALATLIPSNCQDEQNLRDLAFRILETMADKIGSAVEKLQQTWREEPAYKVWEVLHPQAAASFHVVLSGGGAKGLASFLNRRLKTDVRLGTYAASSNAVGTALARPTLSCTLQLDTLMRRYRIEETGEQGEWKGKIRPYQEVEEFLYDLAQKYAREMGIELKEVIKEPFDYFPIVHGYETVGQIVRGSLHVSPGVIGRVM